MVNPPPGDMQDDLETHSAGPVDDTGPGPPPDAISSSHHLSEAVAPLLIEACEGRLAAVKWFRTEWQRGGALTGYSTYRAGADDHPVVVKLPVPPRERRWLNHLTTFGDVCPTVYEAGTSIGQYDMAWVVMERLPHGPLSPAWDGVQFDLLLEAAARFYRAAASVPIDMPRPQRDWRQILDKARQAVSQLENVDRKRWNKVLKKAQKKLPNWLDIWLDRPTTDWCHGDLHLANAMTREPPPGGPALLFDYARVHPGHWVEDAVYLEYQYWGHRDLLKGRKLSKQLAQCRRALSLPVEEGWSTYAQVRRAMLAMSAPAMSEHHAEPLHLDESLRMLESEVGK